MRHVHSASAAAEPSVYSLLTLALLLVPTLWVARLPAAPATAAASSEPDAAQAKLLVRQLGDPSYIARRRAARLLTGLGIEGEPALTAALDDPQPEVRRRAHEILTAVRRVDFQNRLEAFAMDPDASHDYRLPAWSRFRKLLGDSRGARSLFVEMQRCEPALLDALEGDAKSLDEAFASRCEALLGAMEDRGAWHVSTGTIASLLLVSSTEAIAVDEPTAILLYNFMLQRSFREAVRSGDASPVLKKLLCTWVRKNNSSELALQNLMLSFALDLDAALDSALDILRLRPQRPNALQYALLGIGRYGDRQHLPIIEPHLVDTTLCDVRQVDGRQVQAQVRDIALAVTVAITGQSLTEYGFAEAKLSDYALMHPGTLGFAQPAQRDAAFAKWAAWKTSQQH